MQSIAGVTTELDAPTLHYNLTVIEFADPLTLDQVIADSSGKGPMLVRLSGTVAPVESRHSDAVIERLRKLGHLPEVLD